MSSASTATLEQAVRKVPRSRLEGVAASCGALGEAGLAAARAAGRGKTPEQVASLSGEVAAAVSEGGDGDRPGRGPGRPTPRRSGA